ncbi:MAG: hypothetical protein OHK0039_04480 [Bacteroidia bacterium]
MKQILYVEDDEINAFVIRAMLKAHYEVTVASTPNAALEAVYNHAFQLILMDINLGEDQIDGVELMQRIRQLPAYAETPIFAVTAYAMPGDAAYFQQAGFDRYYAKPVRKAELLAGMADILS